MAEFDIDVTELDQFANRLREVSNAGATSFQGIALKYRDLTMNHARKTVRVRTGELRASIQPTTSEASKAGLSASWEVTARHASPIEYGFVHYQTGRFIGPFPYVRPAMKLYRKAFIEEMATAAKSQFGTFKYVTRGL